jgi:hypothetical protein
MKLRMFVITAALVMVGSTAFATGASNAQKPNAVFRQVKYHFKAVVEGTHVTHGFAVKNTGSGTLDIARVKTG